MTGLPGDAIELLPRRTPPLIAAGGRRRTPRRWIAGGTSVWTRASTGWAVLERHREFPARHTPRHANAPWFVVNSQFRADAERVRAAGRPDVVPRPVTAV